MLFTWTEMRSHVKVDWSSLSISDDHVDHASFDAALIDPAKWFACTAALWRSHRALARQSQIDFGVLLLMKEALANGMKPGEHIFIGFQVELMAALALETALKAAIASSAWKRPNVTLPPRWFQSHDLGELALRAHITASDDAEREVLAHGHQITEFIGRYPTATAAEQQPGEHGIHFDNFESACERLILRCLEKVIRLTHEVSGDREDVEIAILQARQKFERNTGGIAAPTRADSQQLFVPK